MVKKQRRLSTQAERKSTYPSNLSITLCHTVERNRPRLKNGMEAWLGGVSCMCLVGSHTVGRDRPQLVISIYMFFLKNIYLYIYLYIYVYENYIEEVHNRVEVSIG